MNIRNQLAFGGRKSLLSLVRNTDLVPVNSILERSTGTVALSATAGVGDSVLTVKKTDRIRQDGVVVKIDLAEIRSLTNITRFYLYIWRFNGSTYDQIASYNLLSSVVVGLNTVTFSTPIEVKEGDFYQFNLTSVGGNVAMLSATLTSAGSRFTTTETPATTGYDWNSKSTTDYVARSIMHMQAPLVVCIGDSIMESYPLHTSFVDAGYLTVDLPKSWQYKARLLDSRFIYQNLGVGGQNSTQVLARFDAQVVAAKPRIAIINSGLNDLGQSVNKATFIANVTSMLNKCSSAGIVPILWEIPPCNNLTNIQMQYRDDWNVTLRTLILSYPNSKIVNFDDMGVNRVGGDAGNFWNINPVYAYGDGTHYNEVGNQFIANKMYNILK